MLVNWEELEISKAELETLINFDLLSTWAMNLSRVFLLRNKAYSQTLLFTEGGSLFLIYFGIFPLNLIIFRNLGWLSNNYQGLILVLLSTAILALLTISLFNIYLWQRAKRLKIFAILLEKVKQYNNLISHLKLFTELNSLNSSAETNSQSTEQLELKQALELTKNSLLKSIELEKILNRARLEWAEPNRQMANNRYQLLANLESGLINLESLLPEESNDYQQLLTEAITIGLSVHKEVRKTRTPRQ